MQPNPAQIEGQKTEARTTDKRKDCLSCRLWGGTVLTGFGAMVAANGSKMATPAARASVCAAGAAVGCVGLARLFGLPPFTQA
jgi:hypothetical protein